MSEWEIVSLSCAPSPCYKANCAPLILRNFIAVIMNCWAIQETNVAAPKTDALTHMAMPIAAHVYGVMPISTLYTQKHNNDIAVGLFQASIYCRKSVKRLEGNLEVQSPKQDQVTDYNIHIISNLHCNYTTWCSADCPSVRFQYNVL